MADLVVVTGPPGAGKSTVARALAGMFEPSALVAGDEFFAFVRRGYIDPWMGPAHRQNEVVVAAAAAAAGRLTAGGYTVVYDGVVGPWFLEAFASAAGLTDLHYAVLLPPARLCLQRVHDRPGHGFTDLDAAAHMHEEFAGADLDRRHVVISTDEPQVIATALCRSVQDGSLRWTGARAGHDR